MAYLFDVMLNKKWITQENVSILCFYVTPLFKSGDHLISGHLDFLVYKDSR